MFLIRIIGCANLSIEGRLIKNGTDKEKEKDHQRIPESLNEVAYYVQMRFWVGGPFSSGLFPAQDVEQVGSGIGLALEDLFSNRLTLVGVVGLEDVIHVVGLSSQLAEDVDHSHSGCHIVSLISYLVQEGYMQDVL